MWVLLPARTRPVDCTVCGKSTQSSGLVSSERAYILSTTLSFLFVCPLLRRGPHQRQFAGAQLRMLAPALVPLREGSAGASTSTPAALKASEARHACACAFSCGSRGACCTLQSGRGGAQGLPRGCRAAAPRLHSMLPLLTVGGRVGTSRPRFQKPSSFSFRFLFLFLFPQQALLKEK